MKFFLFFLSLSAQSCDPFLQICANYTDHDACPMQDGTASLVMTSPNSTNFFYIGSPILVNYTFTPTTNPAYPSTGVYVYLRAAGDKDYKFLKMITKRQYYDYIVIDNVTPGSFQILLLVDNIDRTGTSKVGTSVNNV